MNAYARAVNAYARATVSRNLNVTEVNRSANTT